MNPSDCQICRQVDLLIINPWGPYGLDKKKIEILKSLNSLFDTGTYEIDYKYEERRKYFVCPVCGTCYELTESVDWEVGHDDFHLRRIEKESAERIIQLNRDRHPFWGNWYSSFDNTDLKRIADFFQQGGNPDAGTFPGEKSPLMDACINCKFKIAELLIEHGADVHFFLDRKDEKCSILRFAIANNSLSTTKLLLEKGAVLTEGDISFLRWKIGKSPESISPEIIQLIGL